MLDLGLLTLLLLLVGASYVIYQRFFHPLSGFPGPFTASVTNFWRFYHELRGDLPAVIHEYHKRYGNFVRVAPNEINVNTADVVDVVYKRGGRHYLKSDFYDGFTAIRPNMFGTRDEDLHSLRRRQMAHGFSQASFVKMEYIFNQNVVALLDKLDLRVKTGKPFNLGTLLRFFAQDCNGELSLGVNFGMQEADDRNRLLPLNDHFALAKMTGFVPWLKKPFNRYSHLLPWPYLQRLVSSRAWLRGEAVRLTALAFKSVGRDLGDIRDEDEPSKINLLTSLATAKDPETGEYIEQEDVVSNAFSFLTAGAHTTSATSEILWWYLLHYPEVMKKTVAELRGDPELQGATSNTDMIPYAGLEARLPYLSAVIQECFRLNPVFQSPSPRITPPEGDPRYPTIIDGTVVPPGMVVSATVYSLHRNEAVWGSDAAKFRPERWLVDDTTKEKARFMMHFGAGHRACIGRNEALIMLWKVVVEVLRRFDVVLAEEAGDVGRKEPEIRVVGFAEIAKPLIVEVERR